MQKKQCNKSLYAKPFLKWAGGKTQLLHEISDALPHDFAERYTTYVEPFVGGGSVLFWILRNFPNITHAVINDINPKLISTYRTVKNKPEELIYELGRLQNEYLALNAEARKTYFLDKRSLFNENRLDETTLSAIFIFLNRTCFNGLYRVNSKGEFNVPHGRYTRPLICDESTIKADSELLQRVEILNGDFARTISHAKKHTLFYLDPPYKPLNKTSSFNSYSNEDFDDKQQIRLRDFCNEISDKECDFILSNSDMKNTDPENYFFDDLYKSFNIKRVFASRAVNSKADKRGKLTELLISNT